MTLDAVHRIAAAEVKVDLGAPLTARGFADWYEAVTRITDHVADTRARLERQYERSAAKREAMGRRKVRRDRSPIYSVDEALLRDVTLTADQVAARLDGISASMVRKRRSQLGVKIPRKAWAAGGATWTSTGTNGSSGSTRATSTRS